MPCLGACCTVCIVSRIRSCFVDIFIFLHMVRNMLCVTSGSLLLVRVVDLACIRVERKVCLSFIMLSMRAVGGLRDEMLGDENF